MSCQLRQVNEEEILRSETILLPQGGSFDLERRTFIKNLETVDLQAVPGSGKTTALLAKLLILESRLPLPRGAGILVLSHTNNAVDQLRQSLKGYCPRLMSGPSFVGTIQSFVDKFLAVPYYHAKVKRPIRIIDTVAFLEEIEHALGYNVAGVSGTALRDTRSFLNGIGDRRRLLRLGWEPGSGLHAQCDGKELAVKKPGGTRVKNWIDWSDQEKTQIKDCVFKILKRILTERGVLSFDDAYMLSEMYLHHVPRILEVIRLRFPLVLVDEMQDMEAHQHHILEALFNCDGVTYQRVGDNNQAIFTEAATNLESLWSDRPPERTLTLSGSHRLTPQVAKVVERFAVRTGTTIKGLQPDGPLPIAMVFDDSTTKDVLPHFSKLLVEMMGDGGLDGVDTPIKAIGWRRTTEKGHSITDYFPEWTVLAGSTTPRLVSLVDYLTSAASRIENRSSTGAAYGLLMKAMCRALRMDEVACPLRYWTVSTLGKQLKLLPLSKYREFRAGMLSCLKQLERGDISGAGLTFKELYKPFSTALGEASSTGSGLFFTSPLSGTKKDKEEAKSNNRYEDPTSGLCIEVDTVHACKGQTHLATLYLETFYQGKHESDRLPGNFTSSASITGVYGKASARVAFVGFSRPSKILAFAVHRSRFAALGLNPAEWEIVDLDKVDGSEGIP